MPVMPFAGQGKKQGYGRGDHLTAVDEQRLDAGIGVAALQPGGGEDMLYVGDGVGQNWILDFGCPLWPGIVNG